jgi:hypothetical protein
MPESEEVYWLRGYNGFWDGYWPDTLTAKRELQEYDPDRWAAFVKGWNTAVIEHQQSQIS